MGMVKPSNMHSDVEKEDCTPLATVCIFTNAYLSDIAGIPPIEHRRQRTRVRGPPSAVDRELPDRLARSEVDGCWDDREACPLSAEEVELAAQMAALGLPTNFTARPVHVKSSRKRSTAAAEWAEADVLQQQGDAADLATGGHTAAGEPGPEERPSGTSGTGEASTAGGVQHFEWGFACGSWQAIHDARYGCYYYADIRSGQSQWEVPDELQPLLQQQEAPGYSQRVQQEGIQTADFNAVDRGNDLQAGVMTNEVPSGESDDVSASVNAPTVLPSSSFTEALLSQALDSAAESSDALGHLDTPTAAEVPPCDAEAGAGGDSGAALVALATTGGVADERSSKSGGVEGGVEKHPREVALKYWNQRYRLFSKFDEGIMIDAEGWYSVTPEAIALHHARRAAGCGVAVDAFVGAGGNAIQLALTCDRVIAVDLDPGKIECSRKNAEVYGVADKIEFVLGDFFELAPRLKADVIFMSPPWGGPQYSQVATYDLETMVPPIGGVELFKIALSVAPNVIFFLPKNVDPEQLAELAWLQNPPLRCEIEKNFMGEKLKTVTAYYGDLFGSKPS